MSEFLNYYLIYWKFNNFSISELYSNIIFKIYVIWNWITNNLTTSYIIHIILSSLTNEKVKKNSFSLAFLVLILKSFEKNRRDRIFVICKAEATWKRPGPCRVGCIYPSSCLRLSLRRHNILYYIHVECVVKGCVVYKI